MENDTNFQHAIATNEWVMVEWWAEWCASCKAMFAKIADVAEHFKEKCPVVAIDAGKQMGIAQKYGVMGLPCFTLFHNGKPVSSKPGVQTVKGLIEWIQENMNDAS